MGKKASKRMYRVSGILGYILGGICMVLGLISITAGGIIFIIFGVLFMVLGRMCRKEGKDKPGEKPVVNVKTHSKPVNSELLSPIKKENVETVKPTQTVNQKIHTYKVTGMSYRIENVMKLASKNDDYDLTKKEMIESGLDGTRTYEYDFFGFKTELVPEPDNPYDPNAVKVVVDNNHVGYIKSGSCKHILNLLKENRIGKIDCEIGGGKYKYLSYDEENDSYFIERGETHIFVHLKIWES